jgi:hypothetical protein
LKGVVVQDTEGWSLLNRLTLVVLDGPGDEGFLVRRADPTDGDRAPANWDALVSSHDGAWMLLDSGDSIFARRID